VVNPRVAQWRFEHVEFLIADVGHHQSQFARLRQLLEAKEAAGRYGKDLCLPPRAALLQEIGRS
jgi:hypothetical protein